MKLPSILAAGLLTSTSLSAHAVPLINEFVANHTGTDDHEYVEVFGLPSTDYSAYTLVQIEGDGSGAGVVDSVWTVGTTDASGFWTTGFLSNVIENGSITLMMVLGWTGSVGLDLDTNNDGVIDSAQWTTMVDGIAVSDGGTEDQTYTSALLSPNFDDSVFTPRGASRIPNGTDTNTSADWVRNDFDLAGIPGFIGTLVSGEVANTPGACNDDTCDVSPVPAPASVALLGLGLAALGVAKRRTRMT